MKVVIQKVKKCTLYSNGEKYSEIKNGMLVLVGVSTDDTQQNAQKLAQKVLKMRIFDDENGKTNKSIFDVNGEIMVVSNFTLYANLKGIRSKTYGFPRFLGFLFYRRLLNSRRTVVRLRSQTTLSALNPFAPAVAFRHNRLIIGTSR